MDSAGCGVVDAPGGDRAAQGCWAWGAAQMAAVRAGCVLVPSRRREHRVWGRPVVSLLGSVRELQPAGS